MNLSSQHNVGIIHRENLNLLWKVFYSILNKAYYRKMLMFFWTSRTLKVRNERKANMFCEGATPEELCINWYILKYKLISKYSLSSLLTNL